MRAIVAERTRMEAAPTSRRRPLAASLAVLISAFVLASSGCSQSPSGTGRFSFEVPIDTASLASLQPHTALAVTSAPPSLMKGSGLAGVVGGAHLKLLKAGRHAVLLPMPQLTESQVPLAYAITTTPMDVGREYHLCRRENSGVVVRLQLEGTPDQEVQINWSATILITGSSASSPATNAASYVSPTACVQSEASAIRVLADKLWPTNGAVRGYAANIQAFVRGMKQQNPPRSMDAVGMLGSGANWICTANANLAVALLRAKHIPARSLATIPTIGQRLEMHRIAEYVEGGAWHQCDPSSLQTNIPMNPWQNIVMAWTTLEDESSAMTPRMGSSLGCPYGQELELLDSGITLWGQDFFWTQGAGLAEFDPRDEAVTLARAAWGHFLQTGKLDQTLLRGASTTDADGLRQWLKTK